MKTKNEFRAWPYHAIALALVLFGYFYNGVYVLNTYELTGINEVTLIGKELWWVGVALVVEVAGVISALKWRQ